MITQDEAQRLHEQRREADDQHDDIGCWCCCLTCDFDTKTISDFLDPDETAQILANPQVMADLAQSERDIAEGNVIGVDEVREALWYRLADRALLEREDVQESLAQMRRGEGRVIHPGELDGEDRDAAGA